MAAEVLELITGAGTKEFDLKGLCGLQLATCYRARNTHSLHSRCRG